MKTFIDKIISNNGHDTSNYSNEPIKEEVTLTGEQRFNYNFHGFRSAGSVNGNLSALENNLEGLYENLVEKSNKNSNLNEIKKREIETVIKSLKLEIEHLKNDSKDIDDRVIPELKRKIKDLKDEINEIKENPEIITQSKKDIFNTWLSGIILIPVSLFLWVFYSSVTFSAFFREITFDKDSIFNTIFYERAIEESLSKGFTATILVFSAPFVFIILGVLFHKYKEMKKNIAAYLFLLLAFMLDGLLAFEIARKIADAKLINTFEAVKTYGIPDALMDVNFWLIIFFGFITYLSWGILLHFFMDTFKDMNPNKAGIERRKEQIIESGKEISNYMNEKKSIRENIMNKEIEVQRNEKKLSSVFVDLKELGRIASDYVDGWIKYLSNAGMGESEINRAYRIKKEFLIQFGVED